MKEITFLISDKGRVTLEDATGFGSGCQEATEMIEKMLGTPDNSSRDLTQAYYEDVPDSQLSITG